MEVMPQVETITETDLDWTVLVEGESAEEFACERQPCCDREAVRLTVWAGDQSSPEPCVAHRRKILLCLPCYERWANKGSGLVLCSACDDSGVVSFVKIVHAEPVRKFS